MYFKKWRFVSLIAALAATYLSPSAGRAAAFDEAVLGDLSGVPAAPTPWALSPGANPLIGAAGTDAANGTVDFDLVALEIPAGHQLDSITIVSYTNPDAFAQSFFGLQPGSPWLDGLGFDINGAWLMGWAHVQTHMAGFDLLAMIQDHANEPAFDIPVPAGVYTMLIEDVDTTITYSLLFNVSAVPEPASAALLATAAIGFVAMRRTPRAAVRAGSDS